MIRSAAALALAMLVATSAPASATVDAAKGPRPAAPLSMAKAKAALLTGPQAAAAWDYGGQLTVWTEGRNGCTADPYVLCAATWDASIKMGVYPYSAQVEALASVAAAKGELGKSAQAMTQAGWVVDAQSPQAVQGHQEGATNSVAWVSLRKGANLASGGCTRRAPTTDFGPLRACAMAIAKAQAKRLPG